MFDRTIKLLGEDIVEKIKNTSILLIGLGGVGGYAFEALVRSGFLDITIIDYDKFELSNLNRQVLATRDVLEKSKCDVAYNRGMLINKEVKIKSIEKKLEKDDINKDFLHNFDYILDACDSVDVKVKLIALATHENMHLLSCMGTANRCHPELLQITKLQNTHDDPLAKKIRVALKDDKQALKTKVIWSQEIPLKQKNLGTICSLPMSAGSLMVSYVINEIKKEEN